ncbi:antirestriction protein [Caudoviricetes sp.]|nr:antirestriction protein [Caudoviricetes sp.]
MSNAVYEVINQRILDALEKGTIPWRKPWSGGGAARNLVSGKEYRGINSFILNLSDYQSPYWLTFKQAKDLGGSVRKGEKGSPVMFWNFKEVTEDGKEKTIPICRYYTVFNVAQCDGIESPDALVFVNTFTPIERAEMIVKSFASCPAIEHGSKGAFYRPANDTVSMPNRETFDTPSDYYAVLFHELGHSTGHEKRLNRDGIVHFNGFGSHSYSKEELVAEFTAAFLCGHAGIDNTLDRSAAYIASWLKVLRDNKTWLASAAGQAQKAADLILNTNTKESE